jgi:Tfp pilus assembly protein PilO
MAWRELIDKYRNKAVNIAIIIVFLLIAVNLYKGSLNRVASLKAKISEENKKDAELEKINQLKKKITGYKGLLNRKEASLVMDDISAIARGAGVEILSVKPPQKELPSAEYTKDVFEVSLNAPGYDSLAKFVNGVESSGNVYTVDTISINYQTGPNKKGLTANVRISSVSAINQ